MPNAKYVTSYHVYTCPLCEKRNFVNDTLDADLSRPDYDGMVCWSCGKESLFEGAEEFLTEQEIEEKGYITLDGYEKIE